VQELFLFFLLNGKSPTPFPEWRIISFISFYWAGEEKEFWRVLRRAKSCGPL
jgi:hypothetical protein